MAAVWILVRTGLSMMLKNKKRTVISIVGLAIAVAVLSAEIIAIDSMTENVIEYNLDKIDVDLMLGTDYSDYRNLTEELEEIEGIENVEPISITPFHCQKLAEPVPELFPMNYISERETIVLEEEGVYWKNFTLEKVCGRAEVYGTIRDAVTGEPVSNLDIVVYKGDEEILREDPEYNYHGGETYYSLKLPLGNYSIECIPGNWYELYHVEKFTVAINNTAPIRMDIEMEPLGEATVSLNGSVFDAYTGRRDVPELEKYVDDYWWYRVNYTEVFLKVEGDDYLYYSDVSTVNGTYHFEVHEGIISLYAVKIMANAIQSSEIVTFYVKKGAIITENLTLLRNHIIEVTLLNDGKNDVVNDHWIYIHSRVSLDLYDYYSTPYRYVGITLMEDNVTYKCNFSSLDEGFLIVNESFSKYNKMNYEPDKRETLGVPISAGDRNIYIIKGSLLGEDVPRQFEDIEIYASYQNRNGYSRSESYNIDENGSYQISFTSPTEVHLSLKYLGVTSSDELHEVIQSPKELDYSHTYEPSTSARVYGVDPEWDDLGRLFSRYNVPENCTIGGDRVLISSYLADALELSVGDRVELAQLYYLKQNNSAAREQYYYYSNDYNIQIDVVIRSAEVEIAGIMELDIGLSGEKGNFERSISNREFMVANDFFQYSYFIVMDIDHVDDFLDELFYSVEDYFNHYLMTGESFLEHNVSLGLFRERKISYYYDEEDITNIISSSELFGTHFLYCIWFDNAKVINPFDLETTADNVEDIQYKVKRLHHSHLPEEDVYISNSPVPDIVEKYSARLFYAKLITIAVSLPVMALGLYLTIVGLNLGEGGFRREVSILKTRGVSRRQIGWTMLLQSSVLGIIAGILGLLAGALLSHLFLASDSMLDAVFFMKREAAGTMGDYTLFISTTNVLILLFSAVAIMTVISLRSIKRISRLEVIEGLSAFTGDTAKRKYFFKLDLVLLIIALVSYTSINLVDPDAPPDFMGTMGSFIFLQLNTISLAIAPLLPFIFSISVTRMITRKSHHPYTLASYLTRPFTGHLWVVVRKNMSRNRRRVSGLCIIIALSLCFGIYTQGLIDSEYAHEKAMIGYNNPVDITAMGYDSPSFAYNISQVDGVAACSPVVSIQKLVDSEDSGDVYKGIVFLDSDFYMNDVKLRDDFFHGGDGNEMLGKLKDPSQVIISQNLAEKEHLKKGDVINMSLWIEEIIISDSDDHADEHERTEGVFLTVAGVVEHLPGTFLNEETLAIFLDYSPHGSFLYNETFMKEFLPNLEFLQYNNDQIWMSYLITVSPGYSSHSVAEDIYNKFPFQTGLFKIREQEEKDIMGDYNNFIYLMKIEYGFILAITALGLVFIMYASLSERRLETASMRARGASRWDIFRLFMGESVTLMGIGVAIGVLSGWLTGYTFVKIIDRLTDPRFPREFTLQLSTLWLVLYTIILLIAITGLISFLMSGVNLNKALRTRGE